MTIDSCIISNNVSSGGSLITNYVHSRGENIVIKNSQILHNQSHDPTIYIDDMHLEFHDNNMFNNQTSSSVKGIKLSTGSSSIISGSNMSNGGFALKNDEISSFANAINNYWGDQSGPYHPSQNPTGQGDSVNAFVKGTNLIIFQSKTAIRHI